jgi:hypothetical protein
MAGEFMADQSIILASSIMQWSIAPLEHSGGAMARQKCRDLATPPVSAESASACNTSLPPLDLHFIYELTWESGKLGAKRALQATDDYWSHLIDHVG